jgi:hypothetical protein
VDRNAYLTQRLNKNGYGIEIGPFFSPVAPKSQGWNTTVVDFTDQNGLISVAKNHSSDQIRQMVDSIEPVDVVWNGTALDEACLAIREEGFEYLIASHAIEHIPDLISFLQQVSHLAGKDFVLSLAVPDCRQTFDFFTPLSTTANALTAFREERKLHAPDTMFSVRAYMTWMDGASTWPVNAKGNLSLPEPLENAHFLYLEYLKNLEAGTQTYVDAHCWYWTPSSFRLMMLELNALGYIDFVVDDLVPGPQSEFLTQLSIGHHGLSKKDLHDTRIKLLAETRRELADTLRNLPLSSPKPTEMIAKPSFLRRFLGALQGQQPQAA